MTIMQFHVRPAHVQTTVARLVNTFPTSQRTVFTTAPLNLEHTQHRDTLQLQDTLILSVLLCLRPTIVMPVNIFIPPRMLHVPYIMIPYVMILIIHR
jgi:hypothetical protein